MRRSESALHDLLGIPQEVAEADLESACYAGKCIEGDRFFHSLHFANVFWVQISKFAKPFLGHFRSLSMTTNGLGQRFAMRKWFRHSWQE